MAYQTIFKRYEIKYLLTKKQREVIEEAMQPYMSVDRYGESTIRNLYFDTDNYRLIRRSLEKPLYKEKLRVRSYQTVAPTDDVFVELKKKYNSVVYKRRLILSQQDVEKAFEENLPLPVTSQIGNEIAYFRSFYETLHPTVFLSYHRVAHHATDDPDFRVTFDSDILYRRSDLSLTKEAYGIPILHPDQTIMEIKTTGAVPLWMTKILTDQQIYKTSYSKYGTAFLQMAEAERRRIHSYEQHF